MIFIDEFGFNLAMAPASAWAPCGIRAYSAVPFNPGENITLTMGISLEGVVAPFAAPGGTDGFFFRNYVERVLVPELRPGDVVLYDNLSAHKVAGVREAIEAAGARVVLLPPYSPDLSPVENCGAKVKAGVRGEAPRTRPGIYAAMGRALHGVTQSDARGWFTNAGYRLKPG
jgi:transposase